MHNDVTKRLYDAFPPERKGDFWAGYLYLKYTEHFLNQSAENAGLEPKKLPPLDPGIQEMLRAMSWQIGENSASAETSLYHGKVMRHQEALKLVTEKEDVNLSPSERVIPFKIARDIILENPTSIALGPCPCRSASTNPCLPPEKQEVCMFLGEPWVSFMDEQNEKYHRISQEQAVDVLEECHANGFVHTAYFEHAVGNRMDAICNCCSCCCMGVKMWNLLEGAVPLLAPSGYVAEVDEDCTGCGLCADSTCNFSAISLTEDGQKAVIDLNKCMGCGVCEDLCSVGALHLRREPTKGDPLDLDELKKAAAAP
jgi:Pyruvate/2-oxoacid:ferredoxin oxidoreductase delta subunit